MSLLKRILLGEEEDPERAEVRRIVGSLPDNLLGMRENRQNLSKLSLQDLESTLSHRRDYAKKYGSYKNVPDGDQ